MAYISKEKEKIKIKRKKSSIGNIYYKKNNEKEN